MFDTLIPLIIALPLAGFLFTAASAGGSASAPTSSRSAGSCSPG